LFEQSSNIFKQSCHLANNTPSRDLGVKIETHLELFVVQVGHAPKIQKLISGAVLTVLITLVGSVQGFQSSAFFLIAKVL